MLTLHLFLCVPLRPLHLHVESLPRFLCIAADKNLAAAAAMVISVEVAYMPSIVKCYPFIFLKSIDIGERELNKGNQYVKRKERQQHISAFWEKRRI
jgi:hypothetical protein